MSTTPTIPQVDEQELPQIDYRALYEDQREENERLKAVVSAARIRTDNERQDALYQSRDRKPGLTTDRLKAQIGALAFQKMTRNEKLTALGVDPATSDDLLKQLFGRGSNGQLTADLKKSDPYRYRLLREGAIALNLYGA